MIRVLALDHLVLTCRDLAATEAFYAGVLGMEREVFAGGRVALRFGRQKFNLHPYPTPHAPLVARVAEPGTADICLIVEGPLETVEETLRAKGIAIELGPVERSGAVGPIRSLYCRDPDGNLVELSIYP